MVQLNALTVFLCTLIVQMFYLFFFVYPESWTLDRMKKHFWMPLRRKD